MNHTSRQFTYLIAGLLLALFVVPNMLLAQSMSSTNYKVPFQALGAGGDNSTSTNYALEDTLSEVGANATGENLSSTNYKACAGYQCLKQAGFITYVFATSDSACTSSTTGGTFTVALGTLTTSSVSTGAKHVCPRVSTNAVNGVAISVTSNNAGLASMSVPADKVSSSSATLSAGTEGYGVCSTNAANGFTAQAPFNGTCNTGAGHAVGGVTTSAQDILSASGSVTDAFGDVLTKAAISTTTPAHDDYGDTLTFIATATY